MAGYIDSTETKPLYALAACAAYFGSFAIGAALGYSSPVTKVFKVDFSDFSSDIFGSILTIGALIGGLVAGLFTEKLGRKTTIQITAAVFAGGWALMLVRTELWMVYASRFILGLAIGIDCMVLPVYIGEATPAERRGIYVAGHQFNIVLGILVTYVFGVMLKPTALAVTCMVPVLLNAVAIVFMPESPTWLVKKNMPNSDVMTSLYFLFGRTVRAEAQREILQEAQQSEFNDFSLGDAFQPSVYKPLLITLALMMAQQLSGINAVIFYTEKIFNSAGTKMDAAIEAIIVGTVNVVFTIPGTLLMDKAGRRILLLISSTVALLGLVMLIVFYVILGDATEAPAGLSWMPPTALSIYVAGFACGLGPVPWLMMSELLPARARGAGTGICTAFNWFCAFMVTKFFPTLSVSAGQPFSYGIFAVITLIGILFIALCVPETKGKSLQEVEAIFQTPADINMDSVDTIESPGASFKIQ